jgi:hypothetical protein
MKNNFPSTLLLIFLSSCIVKTKVDDVKSFMLGTYVRPFDNEFYKGVDTLHIEPLAGNTYRIYNYGSYLQKSSGKQKSEKELWTGVYNLEDRVLYETKQGKVISFDPGKRLLHVGGSQYHKIEN